MENTLYGQEMAKAKKVYNKPKHPPYMAMVIDAIQDLNVRNSGVSRAKIVQHLFSKFNVEEVNAPALKRAIKTAIEKGKIEAKGTGKYILTNAHKLELKKRKKKIKNDDSAEKENVIPKEVEKETKTNTKKAPKAKENKTKWKKGDPIRKPTTLDEGLALAKENATRNLNASDLDEPVPSTSKQRFPKKGKTSQSNLLM